MVVFRSTTLMQLQQFAVKFPTNDVETIVARLRHEDYTILLPDTMIWPSLFDVYAKSRFLRCMEPENQITSSLSVVTK